MNNRYTKEQYDFIKENALEISNAELTQMFNNHFKLNLKISQIKSFKNNNKLGGRFGHELNGCFSKGHIPFNKGAKIICSKGSEKAWFKKGNIPYTHKPVGTEIITENGYTKVKVAEPNRWKLKKQIIWEEHNGKIPKGYVVIFGDSNKNNFDINNLILVSRQQLLILNQNNLIKDDADLTKTGVIIADIYQKISKRKGP